MCVCGGGVKDGSCEQRGRGGDTAEQIEDIRGRKIKPNNAPKAATLLGLLPLGTLFALSGNRNLDEIFRTRLAGFVAITGAGLVGLVATTGFGRAASRSVSYASML